MSNRARLLYQQSFRTQESIDHQQKVDKENACLRAVDLIYAELEGIFKKGKTQTTIHPLYGYKEAFECGAKRVAKDGVHVTYLGQERDTYTSDMKAVFEISYQHKK